MTSTWEKLLKLVGIFAVTAIVSVLVFKSFKKPVVTEDFVEKNPSYKHSLKVANKTIRTYRSPAAVQKFERERKDFNESSNSFDSGSRSGSEGYESGEESSATSVKENIEHDERPRSPTPYRQNSARTSDSGSSSAKTGANPSASSNPLARPGSTGTLIPGQIPVGTKTPGSPANSQTTTDSESHATTPTTPVPMITGKVKPLVGIVASQKFDFFISSAYAANTCVNPRIKLFDLTNMSVLLDNQISDSVISGATNFTFDPKGLNLDLNHPSRYLLHTYGCTTNYKRVVTSFFTAQDLDFVTTLISTMMNTAGAAAVSGASSTTLEQLYESVGTSISSGSDFEDIFDAINNSPGLTTLFEETFSGEHLNELTEAAPDLNQVTYRTGLAEKTSYTYEVTSSHWNPLYQIAQEWQVNGVTVSNSLVWNYVPTANSPSTEIITLITGKKNTLDNNVDRASPYHEVSWDITIADAFPVTAPIISLNAVTTNPSATRNISLDLSTGVVASGIYPNCETFSSFAITENGATPVDADFTNSCSTGPIEAVSYTLATATDGAIDLNFWSKDIEGRISSPLTIPLDIDTTAPVIVFDGLQTGYSSDDTHDFSWKLTEAHADHTQDFTVELYDGTSWVAAGTLPLTDGPHSGTLFTQSIALPNVSTNAAKIRVTYSDLLGQQTVVTSGAFNINRPVLGSTPASIDLGSVLNKSLSGATNFVFKNTGIVASKSCTNIALSGTNASEFSITADGCTGNQIAASGSCSMTVKATPTAKSTRTATITLTCGNDTYSTGLTIDSLNNLPVTSDKTASTLEETAVYVTLGSVTDIDGDSVSYFTSSPSSGVLDNCSVVSGNYKCRYTPSLDFNGSDNFTFYGNDGTGDSNTSTATITVLPLNDAPTLSGTLSLSTNEDTALNFDLVAGNDVDGDAITYQITAAPTHGTLVCPTATSVACTYTPQLNYYGSDAFTYRVRDGSLTSATLTASITVNAVNDAPMVAADQSLSTRDNYTYSFSITAGNDVDTAAASLSYKLVSGPATGTLSNCISTGGYSGDRTCDYIAPVNFDGTVSFTYLVYDGALDSTSTATVTITVSDQTSTTPNLSPNNFASTVVTPNVPITLTGASCSDITSVMIQESSTAPAAGASGWQACNTTVGGYGFDPSVTNVQGFRTLRVYGKDAHNNISAPQLINFIFDSLAPQIALDAIPTLPNGIAYPIKWRLTEASILAASTFKLEYSLNGGSTWTTEANVPVGQDGPHSSTLFTYNWNVPAGTYPNSLFRISLTDNTGLTGTTTSASFKILVDINAPNLLAGQMTINGSATPAPTPQKYVNVSLKALDGDTNITHFCLKLDNLAPGASDSCWRAVDAPQPGLVAAPTLDLVNFPFLLGFVAGTYNVYAWTRDLSGNISSNTATLGQDLVSIQYFADSSPVISNFFVSNTPTPPNPITANEMTFDTGDAITIKWTAVDDKGIQSTLQLYYTTDDVTYTEIASNLANGLNNCSTIDEGGTSLDNDSTGCYTWASPVANSQYFKIQLIVTDNANQSTSVTSLPLNSSRFKVLAGNIDPGLNSSAKSAIIATAGNPSVYSLAVASDGKVFVRDAGFGLMYINPRTGIYEQLLPVTGTSSGDGGPVRSASAKAVYKITMDYQDRLIIWDYDRIRRVDTKTEPMQIETIIGAAADGTPGTQTTDTVTDPADLKVYAGPSEFTTFQALPNGDFYFQAGPYGTVDGGNTLRIYRGSLPSPSIMSIRISGAGTADDYAGQLSMTSDTLMGYYLDFDVNTSALNKLMAKLMRYPVGCSFFSMANLDLSSYVSTGPHPPAHVSTCGDGTSRTTNDGKTYHFNNTVAWPVRVSRYDAGTNSNIPVLGSGAQGYCTDGTLATSCNTNLTDVFVTPTGKVFFLDNGLVRVIDDSGNVQTLYGQTKTYGDYGLAQDARFNYIPYIDHGIGDDVIVYDTSEKVLREIRPNQVNMQVVKIAGNGQTGAIDFSMQASMQTLNGASWNQPGTLATNPSNGNVYFPCTWGKICKLDRSTGLWEIFSGNGDAGIHWITTGDIPRNDLVLGGYTPTILGNYSGRMVTGTYEWSGTTSMNSGLRELNEATNMSSFLAGKPELDGATGCPDGAGNMCNLASGRSEGMAMTWHTGMNTWLYRQGNTLRTLSTDASGNGLIGTFTTMPEGISSMVWNGNTLYYCSGDGLLKKMDFGSMSLTNLPFPSAGIRCYGTNILYKNASGSKPARLVFPFRQNGLSGIAEYLYP